jgi:hypothetical protein
MVGVALTQVSQELGDDVLLDPTEVVDTATGQEPDVAPQVTAVGLEGVLRQATLDDQVVEVGAERPLDR